MPLLLIIVIVLMQILVYCLLHVHTIKNYVSPMYCLVHVCQLVYLVSFLCAQEKAVQGNCFWFIQREAASILQYSCIERENVW